MAAFFLSNSSNLFTALPTAAMPIAAPTSISTTTTTFTMPLSVTSMSHRTSQIINKVGSSNRHHIKDFSPVTLSTEWSSMARLLVLAALSVIGSIGNVFMISSVMIEDHLKKAGKFTFFLKFCFDLILFFHSIRKYNHFPDTGNATFLAGLIMNYSIYFSV